MANEIDNGTGFKYHQKDASDTLFSVAYENVSPGASKEVVSQCMANIQDANDFDFENRDVVKIPIPCGGDSVTAKFDVEIAARNLADVFRSGSKFDAAQALSQQLLGLVDTLGSDDRQYNKLMVQLYNNLKDDPNSSVNIATEGWNEQTHTWNKAYVYDSNFPKEPAVPIVQPGTTLNSLAADRAQQLRAQGYYNVSPRDIASRMVSINQLADPNKISVGQPLYLPY